MEEWILTKDSDWGEGYSAAEFSLSPLGHAVWRGELSSRLFHTTTHQPPTTLSPWANQKQDRAIFWPVDQWEHCKLFEVAQLYQDSKSFNLVTLKM